MIVTRTPAGPRVISDVLIVDDHPLYSDALGATLKHELDNCTIRKARTLGETFEILDAGFVPDLIMFDLKLPDVTGISGFNSLKERTPEARILVISSLASVELVQSLLNAGAVGFLPKDASAKTLSFAIGEIEVGRRYIPQQFRLGMDGPERDLHAYKSNPELSRLTPQQIRILKLICVGKPNKQIAYELSLAEATVKAHITALLRRLGVRNRTQAVVMVDQAMSRHGVSEPEARAFLNH